MTWQHPFPKRTITDKFGDTEPPRTSAHRGTDYAPKANSLIKAVTKGTIRKIAWSDCLGWYVVQSGWAQGKTWYVGYHHLSCKTHGINCKGPKVSGCKTPFVRLQVGDKVELGDPVGRVGNSGDCSRGAHLHLTLSRTVNGGVSGKVYDIEKFIDELQNEAKVCPCCKKKL